MIGEELEAGDRVEITSDKLGFCPGMIGHVINPIGMAPGCVTVRFTNHQNTRFDFPSNWLRKLPKPKDVITIYEDLDAYNLEIERKYKEQHEQNGNTNT